jgi:alkanesulfonate monooxygenase SsuD/methylene tetrahydromethanopterin reductase-like flavin-dependent oxidoreductase (luciferase family)
VVETVWTVMGAVGIDTVTLFAATAERTDPVRFGTAIVPAFTRHPLGLVT